MFANHPIDSQHCQHHGPHPTPLCSANPGGPRAGTPPHRQFVARCPVAMVAFYVATGASAGAAFDRYGIHEYQYREDESNLMGEPTARDDAERIWGARCARIFGCGGGKDRSGPGGTKQTTPAV